MHLKRSLSISTAVIATSLAPAVAAHAQMLGAPVLQSAFTNRGLTVGLDFGAATDVSTYGSAAAWSPASEKYQFSAGVAYLHQKDVSGTATYGVRLMVPVLGHQSPFGVAPFVGMGGANFSGVNDWQIPLGISAGYRRALGTSGRGVSGYLSPFYTWARVRANGQTQTHGLFRVSAGVDVAVLPSVGVTVGYETGANAGEGEPGATGGSFGLGVSYALHHARAQEGAAPASASAQTPASTP
ncbi:MAG: hypothetical protein JJD97_03870 [Gemmatimonadaceae bacterium]|nr:hypothetical protein [Gemmatimonadaceae bacterium]